MSLTANTTPILLIIFNRPDKVKELIGALAATKPKHVYIAADGPREHVPADKIKCAETRALVNSLPWECEIHTNFQTTNLGCKHGVSTAITWFFEQVPAGIILEDDCIPTPSFFSYAAELLDRYNDNEKVMHISGSTFIDSHRRTQPDTSYHFSHISLIWGWATWRRAWKKYDIEMKGLTTLPQELKDRKIFTASRYRHYWITLFRHIRDAKIDTWDAQWLYTILKSGGICITPAHNLIKNIGFDGDATHTTEAVSFARGLGEVTLPLVHPTNIAVDEQADKDTMNIAFVNTFTKHVKYHIRSLLNI